MQKKQFIILTLLFLLCSKVALAHVIPFELDAVESGGNLFWKYIVVGYQHIIPEGYDHILFILCVFFLNASVKKIILQASMFTLAHSLTLAMAMYGVIKPPAAIIEPLIALSIVFLALENVFSDKVKPWRIVMVFLFGLVHGMGFASDLIKKLSDVGLQRSQFAMPLIGFNIGVELGQLTIILIMYWLVAKPFGKYPWYRRRIVVPASILIAVIAAYWTVERAFFTKRPAVAFMPQSTQQAAHLNNVLPAAPATFYFIPGNRNDFCSVSKLQRPFNSLIDSLC